ncbi:SMI1/KNR4 family protein [Streptomyces sp. NPDC091292]|uniref:SMI1/KNR4 family protein n=1 Tax=Streptomyces sp. NPDC091292 TaxID=3365991 RepID=UPI003810AB33
MTEIEQLLTRLAVRARETRPWGWSSLPDPVDAESVARAEAALGFPLPPLLAALYLRIGDGGFGPEYGLLPLLEGFPAGEMPAVAQYLDHRKDARDDPSWPWPEGLLPISHWGCGMYACVDCLSEDAPVLLFEPNADEADHAWYLDAPSLADWLRTWLDGAGWYEEANDGPDLAPWAGFRSRAEKERTAGEAKAAEAMP